MSKNKQSKNTNVIIPNTLIIFIKTRIPNHTKLIYDPYMTVPISKSHTVYFDPLVKYSKKAINNIHSSFSIDAKYTQFFEANQFDSFIDRIVSSLFGMQKKINLDQSTEEGIVDNNIKLTIQSLFDPNGLFYINKIPYTIIGSHWKKGDWKIDAKPDSKLLSQYSRFSSRFSSGKSALEAADNELHNLQKMYPNSIQGNAESGSMISNEILDIIQKGNNRIITNEKFNISDLNSPALFSDEDHFIIKNDPINFTDDSDLNTDPITFSLLIDKTEFSNYLKMVSFCKMFR